MAILSSFEGKKRLASLPHYSTYFPKEETIHIIYIVATQTWEQIKKKEEKTERGRWSLMRFGTPLLEKLRLAWVYKQASLLHLPSSIRSEACCTL